MWAEGASEGVFWPASFFISELFGLCYQMHMSRAADACSGMRTLLVFGGSCEREVLLDE
jgi:hypothetical protein